MSDGTGGSDIADAKKIPAMYKTTGSHNDANGFTAAVDTSARTGPRQRRRNRREAARQSAAGPSARRASARRTRPKRRARRAAAAPGATSSLAPERDVVRVERHQHVQQPGDNHEGISIFVS